MNVVDNIYYKEGTESLLKDFPNSDKEIILKIASSILYKRYKPVNRKVANKLFNKLKYSNKKILIAINTVLHFYRHNLPKGFKRVPGAYEIVNEDGICLRYNRRVITDRVNEKGYLSCDINYIKPNKNGKMSINTFKHRLVALAWIPNPNNKEQVNHKNGIKTDNRKDNLEWNTLQENIDHAYSNGYYITDKMKLNGNGEDNSQAKLNVKKVIAIRKADSDYRSKIVRELSKTFNVDEIIIRNVIDFVNTVDIPRPKYDKLVRNSRGGTYSIVKVWLCKNSEQYIRSYMQNKVYDFQLQISLTYNISTSTVRDIVARRSWNYDYC